MPATALVILDPDGLVARRVRAAASDLPARVIHVRRADDFLAAVVANPFPIAILAAHPADEREKLLAATRQARGVSILVGALSSWPEELVARELGVVFEARLGLPGAEWTRLLDRVVAAAQARLASAGGQRL